jgi:tryptophan aminotransferase
MTATTERRKEVLQLAEEHGFIILEDDPYYYLYYGKSERPPSYFTLERTVCRQVGRVLRFDSLSKILSAGIRIGFVTGPSALLNAMDMHTATANLQPAGLTQSITYAVLNNWGYDTFIKHTRNVSAFYGQRCAAFDRALRTHLAGLAEWSTPEAGMFFWSAIFPCSHPHYM